MRWDNGTEDSPKSIFQVIVSSPRVTVDSDEVLIPVWEHFSQMSLGIHLNPKTIDISSATWPKMRRSDSNKCDVDVARIIRPQTATLERPRILDVALIGKIDMSLTRKGLLSISNLCIAPLDNIQSKRNSPSSRIKTRKWNSQRKIEIDKEKLKHSRSQSRRCGSRTDESWEEEENSVSESSLGLKKMPNTLRSPARAPRERRLSTNNTQSPRRFIGKQEKVLSPVNSIHNSSSSPSKQKRASPTNVTEDNTNKSSRKTVKRPVIVKKDGKNVDEVFVGPKPADEVPEPCRTCGRPEQPERFHSHPPPSSHKQRQQDNNNNDDPRRSAVTKSSVRKPVAIKYKSSKSTRRKSTDQEIAPPKTPTPKKVASPEVERKSPRSGVFLILDDKKTEKPVVRPGPRTVLCYLCGRDFGTASYPLHEPHCLQRWERENSKLPTQLQRPLPEKPSSPLTVEQWNAFAWEATQANLVPCENCGRTFNPDRLEVHKRSCKPVPGKRSTQQVEEQVDAVKAPPAVYCYICGKMFGTHSISIHEPQCLEKWRLENDKLPVQQRRADPIKPQSRTAAPHVMDCFLCGRELDTRILNKHEDECLARWKKWNRNLPLRQRRPEPERPEFKFNTATGNMDFKATMDAIWQDHLQSLVPCGLGCGRTFNPDRVAVHERGCKGPKK